MNNKSVNTKCPVCGFGVLAGEKYCGECGMLAPCVPAFVNIDSYGKWINLVSIKKKQVNELKRKNQACCSSYDRCFRSRIISGNGLLSNL